MDRGSPLFPVAPKRHRIHGGLQTERQERIFTWASFVVVLLYMALWAAAIQQNREIRNTPVPVVGGDHEEPAAPPPSPVRSITESLTPSMPSPSALSDAMLGFVHPLRGQSGDLRYAPVLPGSAVVQKAPRGARAIIDGRPVNFTAPSQPGIYDFTVEMNRARRDVEDMSIVTLVPISQKKAGRIGTYRLGTWPFEGGEKPRTPRYAAPSGFIHVTPANQDFHVSKHFRLRQFLTKDQQGVWPKYVLVDPLMIDKLELIIQELQQAGVKVQHVHVMSGFRTPRYNAGGGNTAGRASLSRHMYGDGVDVYVDNDKDGAPDDITGDGRVNTRDAERFAAAAEAVERKHPSLIGGIGIYVACCGHGPFTHIDVRGNRARWRGTGNG